MTYLFNDGSKAMKWHRVFADHVQYFGFTQDQAREAIKMNPYLAKHEADLEKVFSEMKFIFKCKINERPNALNQYADWLKERM